MQWTDDLRIETPEQIQVDLELAGIGSRFVAILLDFAIKVLASVVLYVVLIVLAAFVFSIHVPEAYLYALVGFLFALLSLLWQAYDTLFELFWNGQTPGKHAAGIRVMMDGGAPATTMAIVVRNLIKYADVLPINYLLGAFLIVITKKRQRLGDIAAGTVVVRERSEGSPVELPQLIEELASPEYAFTASQLAACGPDLQNTIRSYFYRYDALKPGLRVSLAEQLTDSLRKKLAPLPDLSGRECIHWLASLYQALESFRK